MSYRRPDDYVGPIKDRFQAYIERAEQDDANSIYLADVVDPEYGHRTPYIIPMSQLSDHLSLLGPSKSGKTTIILWSLLYQFIRKQRLFIDHPELTQHNHSIHVLDFKGSKTLLANTIWASHLFGIPLRVFSNSDEFPSLGFNLFRNEWFRALPPLTQAEIVADGFGILLGKSLNEQFYSSQNLMALLAAMKEHPYSIREFAQYLKSATRKADRKTNGRRLAISEYSEHELSETRHILGEASILGEDTKLNITARHPAGIAPEIVRSNIALAEGFRTPTIYFWYLKPFSAARTAQTVLSQVVSSIGALCGLLSDSEDSENYLTQIVFGDELQAVPAIISRALTKWRESRMHMVLSGHCRDDWPVEVREQIATAAGTRIWLSPATSQERKELQELSGEKLDFLRSWSYSRNDLGGATFVDTVRQERVPVIGINELLKVSSDQYSGFLWKRMDLDGANCQLHGRAHVVRLEHIMRKEFQDELLAEPLHRRIRNLGPGYFSKKELREQPRNGKGGRQRFFGFGSKRRKKDKDDT